MKKANLLFLLFEGVYPFKVGGMEIFNYYLINSLKDNYNIFYSSLKSFNFTGGNWMKCFNIRPTKFFYPIQVFFQLLFHNDIKKVVISYSEAHWIIWYLFFKIMQYLNIDYYIIIHHGKQPTKAHFQTYSRFFSGAKTIVAVSEDIKQNYDSLFNINCQVIFPLVPFTKSDVSKKELRLKYHIGLDRFVITQIGTLKKMKNPDTILHTLHSMSDSEFSLINPHVVFAGQGPMINQLQQLVKQYNLDDRVTFLGFVPKEKVNDVYKLSDVYLIASDFEGTSVSLLEAMYNRMPIIASNASGIKDTLTNEEAILFEPKSSEEVLKALLVLSQNSELRNSLGNNAFRKFQRNFSYVEMLNEYKKIFNS